MYHYRHVAVSESLSSVNQNHQAMEASLSNYIRSSSPGELAERQRVVSMIQNYGTLTPLEDVDLFSCTSLTALPEGFNPQGDVDLSGCTGLTALPAGFNPQGNVYLSGCTGLTELPAGFNPQGNVILDRCTGLTALPAGFNPQRNVDFSGCTGLTALPAGFNPKGDVGFWGCTGIAALPAGFKPKRHVGFWGCTGLTSIPDSMFAMDSRLTVNLQDTGLNAATVANIIGRMNAPGYSGPRFVLSVNDGGFRSETQATADKLPELIASIRKDTANSLWTLAASQTDMGNAWNSFAAFVTRVLNETPRFNGHIPEALNQRLHQIFTAMEADFERNGSQLDRCELINSVLSAAQTGIGTCIDKVKVGYLLMQLQVEKSQGVPDAERKIALVNRTIELVEGVNRADVVLDQSTGHFVPVRVDFSDDARYRVHVRDISQTVIVDSSTPLVDVKRIGIAEINTEHGARFKIFRIGDEVEDILNLIYHLHEMAPLHKIDMRFLGCRTITAEHDVDAAVRFIRES